MHWCCTDVQLLQAGVQEPLLSNLGLSLVRLRRSQYQPGVSVCVYAKLEPMCNLIRLKVNAPILCQTGRQLLLPHSMAAQQQGNAVWQCAERCLISVPSTCTSVVSCCRFIGNTWCNRTFNTVVKGTTALLSRLSNAGIAAKTCIVA